MGLTLLLPREKSPHVVKAQPPEAGFGKATVIVRILTLTSALPPPPHELITQGHPWEGMEIRGPDFPWRKWATECVPLKAVACPWPLPESPLPGCLDRSGFPPLFLSTARCSCLATALKAVEPVGPHTETMSSNRPFPLELICSSILSPDRNQLATAGENAGIMMEVCAAFLCYRAEGKSRGWQNQRLRVTARIWDL